MLIQKRRKLGGDIEPCVKKLFLENSNFKNVKVEVAKKNSEREKLHLSGLFLSLSLLNHFHFKYTTCSLC